jgi:hypothetical protein
LVSVDDGGRRGFSCVGCAPWGAGGGIAGWGSRFMGEVASSSSSFLASDGVRAPDVDVVRGVFGSAVWMVCEAYEDEEARVHG